MAEKIKRNTPCPCGSGKKYKKCCMDKNTTTKITDFAWNRLRKTEGEVIDKHLLPYLKKSSKEKLIAEAWFDFVQEEEPEEELSELLHENIFMPWFLFNWIPNKYTLLACNKFKDKPIAIQYLEEQGKKLSDYQKHFIKAICKTHYSFYVVLDVIPEQSLQIRDILLQKEYLVKERSGTKFLHKGDMVFTRVLELDGQAICVGMGPCIIPATHHVQLIEYRKELIEDNDNQVLTQSLLRNEFAEDIQFTFLEIIENLYAGPKMPQLNNTDGDPWQFCKVHFKLHCSPQEALEALLPLTLGGKQEDFLEDVKFSKSGELESINFPWLKKGNKAHKHWENTVMGNLEIDKDELIIEVNSESRAKKAQGEIKKHLGERAELKATIIKSLEQMLESMPDDKLSTSTQKDRLLPVEENEEIKRFAQKHWDSWLSEKIPALNNITPRQAAKTEEGRELLEALFLQMERMSSPDNLANPDIKYLKKELGL